MFKLESSRQIEEVVDVTGLQIVDPETKEKIDELIFVVGDISVEKKSSLISSLKMKLRVRAGKGEAEGNLEDLSAEIDGDNVASSLMSNLDFFCIRRPCNEILGQLTDTQLISVTQHLSEIYKGLAVSTEIEDPEKKTNQRKQA